MVGTATLSVTTTTGSVAVTLDWVTIKNIGGDRCFLNLMQLQLCLISH